MPSRNRLARIQREKEKADILFLIYEQMGPERSLNKLTEIVHTVGIKVSGKTLGRYSVKYEWQRQLLERQVALREAREQEALTAVDKMNEGHIQVNKGLMSLAIAGINYHQNKLEKNRAAGLPQTLNFNVRDIVRLVRQAQLGERLARGEATSRTEIFNEIIGTFVHEFAFMFIAVNGIADPEERKREFARLFDERLSEIYAAQVTQSTVKKVRTEVIGRFE